LALRDVKRVVQHKADAVDIAVEVSRIAATPDGWAERGAALLEPLHQLLPFDGAWLALREEERCPPLPRRPGMLLVRRDSRHLGFLGLFTGNSAVPMSAPSVSGSATLGALSTLSRAAREQASDSGKRTC
jgi:hypothetical protein